VIDRRTFLGALASGLLASPRASEAQQTGKVFRIGFIGNAGASNYPHLTSAFRDGLREHGYVEGHNTIIEFRWAEGDLSRLSALVRELENLNIDVLVVNGNRALLAAQEVKAKTPIVMAFVEDPIELGLVKSLARPGGNFTGVTIQTTSESLGLRLQFLKELLPKDTRMAILSNATSPVNAYYVKAAEEGAHAQGIRYILVSVRAADELERAFAAMKQERTRGLLIIGDPMLGANRQHINELAIRSGIATNWPNREAVAAGGLMSYGASFADLYRRAARLVDRILKGAKPGDVPIEQPSKYELVINLKTAKALGLTIPQSLLLRADQVIE
jgi:putative ABC transport system substrate-binding protein